MNEKNHLSTLYYRNPYLLAMTIIVLIVAGLSAIYTLPRIEDPRITLRNVTIITFLPGAPAERIEALINKKIEVELEEIEEIKEIESIARANVSLIRIELQDSITKETNEEVFSRIRNRLKDVESQLPEGATAPFLDDKRGAVAETLLIALQWNGEGEAPLNLLYRIAQELKDELRFAAQTELVRIYGGIDEEITVTVDPAELAALGLSSQEISQFVGRADSKVSAGQLRGNRHDLKIEIEGALETIARIRRVPIVKSEEGVILKLGDIAEIEKGYKTPVEEIGIYQNKRTLFIAARASENARVDVWTQNILRIIDEFKRTLDPRIQFDIIFNQNEYTSSRLTELVSNLTAGACLVIIIVFLTMGWKSGIIVGLALPLSICGAIFSLNFFDEGIHQMSIFGMIIAIGLLIDSAIVMTDEVRKRVHKGVEREKAMEESVRFLFAPLLTSTFTTILGFMPIFLLPGNAGDFVSPIAISVVLALCFSFFISITIVPSLAARFTHQFTDHEAVHWWQTGLPSPKLFDDYTSFILQSMNYPKTFALISMIPSLIGFWLIPTMPVEFFPPSDRDMFEIKLWTSSESSIQYTLSVVEKADKLLKTLPGVNQIHWLVGGSSPSVYYNQVRIEDRNSSFAQAIVVAENQKKAKELLEEMQSLLNQKIPEGQFVVKAFAQGPPADAPVAFRVIGPQLEQLYYLGEEIRQIMHQFPEITQTRATISGGEPKLWLKADEAQAQQTGLRLKEIANQFESNLEGFTAGSVIEDVEELPVRVQVSDQRRGSLDYIKNLKLVSPSLNDWIPSQSIGNWELKPEIQSIERYNGQRENNVQGFLIPKAKAVSTTNKILRNIQQNVNFPPGYWLEVGGENKEQNQAINNLLIYAPVLIVLIITALILTFSSISLALIISLVGILSVGLGMLALKISGYPLGFNPLIGSIGLIGVALNDTIVILAAIRTNPQAIKGHAEEIINETLGCGRHVLSTTFTTIGGFIPLLLFSGGSFWPPLSVVIAGGLGFSLILAMFFTPLAYKVYADFYYRSQSRGNN
ncbi:MAG: efflux RND transporter permease subunit [Chlamydiales bacterium]